jgi:hypothetical protein
VRVVASLLPKSSNSCQGYPSPHLWQGRASLEQIKSIKEDCLLEAPLIFVGIDVSKAQLDVAIRPSAQSLSVTNDRAGIKSLIKHLKKLRPQLVVLEATGGLERQVLSALIAGEIPVVMANPRHIRDFAKSIVSWLKPIASMPRSSLTTPKLSVPSRALCPTKLAWN